MTVGQPRKQARRGKSPGCEGGAAEDDEPEDATSSGSYAYTTDDDDGDYGDGGDVDDPDYGEATEAAVDGPEESSAVRSTTGASPTSYFTAEDTSSDSMVEEETSLVRACFPSL